MSIFVWDKSFELGIDQFDSHHKHLVGLLNKAYDLFKGKSQESIEPVIDELASYAVYHITAEEHWMGVHGYPELEIHRIEHDRFRRRVLEIHRTFHRGEVNLLPEVLSFLTNWLYDHILITDAKYGQFAAGLPRA